MSSSTTRASRRSSDPPTRAVTPASSSSCSRRSTSRRTPLSLRNDERRPTTSSVPSVRSRARSPVARSVTSRPRPRSCGPSGVAEHDVGAAVVQVADRADGNLTGGVAHGEPARPDGEPHRRGVVGRAPRRTDRHPRRGLGLAVHHPQVPPLTGSSLGPATDPLGVEPASGRGDLAQRGYLSRGRTAGREQLEGVRHAGQGGHPRRTHRAPQGRVDHGGVGEQHRPAHREVRVQHGQAVAVVQRQGRDRPVAGVEPEGCGDVDGVGPHSPGGEAHQLGRAGAARRREQQGQVGVQVVPGRCGPVGDHPPPVSPVARGRPGPRAAPARRRGREPRGARRAPRRGRRGR